MSLGFMGSFRILAKGYGDIEVVDPETHMGRSGLDADQIRDTVQWCGHVRSKSAPRPSAEIMIGVFEDNEKRTLAFFCALAGCTQEHKPYNAENASCDAERFLEDWQLGLKLAEKHGYSFRASTIAWMLEQIWSQIDGMERELSGSGRRHMHQALGLLKAATEAFPPPAPLPGASHAPKHALLIGDDGRLSLSMIQQRDPGLPPRSYTFNLDEDDLRHTPEVIVADIRKLFASTDPNEESS